MQKTAIKTNPFTAGVRFLLAPEATTETPSRPIRPWPSEAWNRAKTVLWITFGVLGALLVGQL